VLEIGVNSNMLYVITGSCVHHSAAEVDMLCGMLCVHLYHCIVVNLNNTLYFHPLMKVCQCASNYRGVESAK